jgi:hypothetical protein
MLTTFFDPKRTRIYVDGFLDVLDAERSAFTAHRTHSRWFRERGRRARPAARGKGGSRGACGRLGFPSDALRLNRGSLCHV